MKEPYLYNEIDVLVNKYKIKNIEELIDVERAITSNVWQDIIEGVIKVKKTFDYNHFKSLHQELFQDIYDWVGKERVVDISKPGTLFCRCLFLEEEAQRIFRGLKKENCFRDVKEKEANER